MNLARGRSPEQLRALGEALTAATEQAIGAPRETIRVILTECDPELWFSGGQTLAEKRAKH